MHFINNTFKKNFIFYSNLNFKTSILPPFPTFHANILRSQKRNFSNISYTPTCIGSQFLWFNNYITIDNNSVPFKEFSSHNINFINQLFTSEGEFYDWNHIERKFQLNDNLCYKYTNFEADTKRKQNGDFCNILDHLLIKNNLLVSSEKLTSKDLYSILISKKTTYTLHSSISTFCSQIQIYTGN